MANGEIAGILAGLAFIAASYIVADRLLARYFTGSWTGTTDDV